MPCADWTSTPPTPSITCSTSRSRRAWPCIYVGEDLDVLLELCDRILVLCGGQVTGIVDARTATKEQVGLLMTKLRKEEQA